MNLKKYILALLAMVPIGYLQAEDFVMVKVPCYQRNSKGDCLSWGGRVKGCKASASAPCSVTDNYQGSTASCTAKPGTSCSAVIPLKDQSNKPLRARGTTLAKIPCNQPDSAEECLNWWVLHQGCIAPVGGQCKTKISDGNRNALCNADSEGSCNSNIIIHG